MGCRQAAGKEWMYQQAKAKCSRNQYGLAEILCRNSEYFQGVRGAGGHANDPTVEGSFQHENENQRRTAGRSPCQLLGGVR